MDKILQKYYEDRFSMMETTGWLELIEDVENMVDAIDTLDSAKTIEELHFKKGELSILKWLLNLKEVSEKSFEEIRKEHETA